MKKTGKTLEVAHEFEAISANGNAEGRFTSPRLYAVDGIPGIFRRVKRSATGLQPGIEGAILAQLENQGHISVVELIRDEAIQSEVFQALQLEEETVSHDQEEGQSCPIPDQKNDPAGSPEGQTESPTRKSLPNR